MHDDFFTYNNLPGVLSKEEFQELFLKMKLGDEDAKEEIIRHNLRLVVYVVNKKFGMVECEKEDLISMGTVGLMKALNTYDEVKNNSFSAYATICIKNTILNFLRKINKEPKVDSLSQSAYHFKDGDDITLEDIIASDIDILNDYTRNETYEIIRNMINNLPSPKREIMILYFYKQLPQREIGKIFSCSGVNISRIIRSIISKFKTELEETGAVEKVR